MVAALTQLTTIPDRQKQASFDGGLDNEISPMTDKSRRYNISMDDVLRDVIISTHSFADPDSPLYHDVDACNLQELVSAVHLHKQRCS